MDSRHQELYSKDCASLHHRRQLDDYYDKFYNKEAKRSKRLQANGNRLAKEIALWKETVAERWDNIRVVSEDVSALNDLATGEKAELTYVIDEQGLQNAVGLELVTLDNDPNKEQKIHHVYPFKMVKEEGNNYTFKLDFEAVEAGPYKYAVRMFPQNKELPHRQDFCYVKWLD